MEKDYSVIGKRLPRPDGVAKATGSAKYTVDVKLPGMLFGKVLRSPYPHAVIKKIDKTRALKLAGVEAVISFEDVPKKPFSMAVNDMLIRDLSVRANREKKDQYVLSEKARYVGDPIAAVAATDASIAEEALSLIELEYEQLPAVFDPLEAMRPGAPGIHDYAENNIAWHQPFLSPTGNLEKGFSEADYVIEETFLSSRQKHCLLEPVSCVAYYDPSDKLIVWSPGQNAYPYRKKMADLFNIPEGRIRWISPHIGGGFGLGTSLKAEPVCIALTMKTRKPVKIAFSREEQFMGTETRHPMIQTGKIGVKRDGTITALETKIIIDGSSYFTHSGAVTNLDLGHFMALYRCENTGGEADIVYTNNPVTGAFRGFGNPQAMWALEQLIDMAAKKIDMDPAEFRLKNHRRTGDPTWIPSIPIENSEMEACIRLGAEKIGWDRKKDKEGEGAKKRGIGMAIMMHCTGNYPILLEHSSAHIKVNEDGSANLTVSPGELGQNIIGTLSQIAAEGLGLPYEDIHVVWGDTDTSVFDVGSHASRSLYMAGNAVKGAAEKAREQILQRAAELMEARVDDLDAMEGRIHVKGSPSKGISIRDVAHDAIYNLKDNVCQISGSHSCEGGQSPVFEAVFAEVEIDIDTGEVVVLKIALAHDIGRSINPMTVEGQIEGGIVQGIGYGLTEDYIVNQANGFVETDNFTSYKIPSTLDLPHIEVILVESPVASGPYGAKSAGESPINSIAPAISNALYDAVGVRIKDLPITPEKVLRALKKI